MRWPAACCGDPVKVGSTWRRAIELAEDARSVQVLDQARLPYEVAWRRLATLAEVATAIRDMTIRGAPLIGATAAYGLAIAMHADPSDAGLAHALTELAATRPTAINLRWALHRMHTQLAPTAHTARAVAAFAEAARVCDEDVALC